MTIAMPSHTMNVILVNASPTSMPRSPGMRLSKSKSPTPGGKGTSIRPPVSSAVGRSYYHPDLCDAPRSCVTPAPRATQRPPDTAATHGRHPATAPGKVAAVLAGARSFTAIGEWAADAPVEVLAALGVRATQGAAVAAGARRRP